MGGVRVYCSDLWRVFVAALGFDPDLLRIMESASYPWAVALGIALLGGMSVLLGQSAILFLNQVSRGGFAVSVVLHGFLYALRFALWAAAIWIIGVRFFAAPPPFAQVLRIVALGGAPFVFGWLILIPHFGPLIARVLYLWAALIVLNAVQFLFRVDFWSALASVVGAWAAVQLAAGVFGRPFLALRDRLHRRIVGVPWVNTPRENLAAIAAELFGPPVPEGER